MKENNCCMIKILVYDFHIQNSNLKKKKKNPTNPCFSWPCFKMLILSSLHWAIEF